MINSKLILDIIDLATDDHEATALLKKQVPFLTVKDLEHTGVGLFVHFEYDKKINEFRLNTDQCKDVNIYGDKIERLDGVEIRNESENILADAGIHLESGLIYFVEIFNKNGEDYPTIEPESYEITQMWLDENTRRTILRTKNISD